MLAGGGARRLGGADKPALRIAQTTLLDRVLAAVAPAPSYVVGPERATTRSVVWLREQPAGGGPVAALAAALPLVTAEVVAVLAADLPFLDAGTVQRLRESMGGRAGALLVDDAGRDQLLVGVWHTAALRGALPADVSGARLSTVLTPLDPVRVLVPPTGRPPWFDCDTAADLEKARRLA